MYDRPLDKKITNYKDLCKYLLYSSSCNNEYVLTYFYNDVNIIENLDERFKKEVIELLNKE